MREKETIITRGIVPRLQIKQALRQTIAIQSISFVKSWIERLITPFMSHSSIGKRHVSYVRLVSKTFLCIFGFLANSCKNLIVLYCYFFLWNVGVIINVKVYCLHQVGYLVWVHLSVSNKTYFVDCNIEIDAYSLFYALNSSSIWPRQSCYIISPRYS